MLAEFGHHYCLLDQRDVQRSQVGRSLGSIVVLAGLLVGLDQAAHGDCVAGIAFKVGGGFLVLPFGEVDGSGSAGIGDFDQVIGVGGSQVAELLQQGLGALLVTIPDRAVHAGAPHLGALFTEQLLGNLMVAVESFFSSLEQLVGGGGIFLIESHGAIGLGFQVGEILLMRFVGDGAIGQ